MPRPRQIHNLGENKSEWSPPRLLFWDTETRPQLEGTGELHELRLWCAELVERRGPSRKRPRADAWEGHTVAQLCDAVEDACRGGERLWMVAHNLGFDLAVTGLPLALIERGWEVGMHALAATSPWLTMRLGKRSLTIVDSGSWLPAPLEQLQDGTGHVKPPLPAWEAPDSEWFARCRADVKILGAAFCALLDWWDRLRLGHFSRTGATTGMNSYRHMGRHSTVVIDPDPELRTVERGLIYGGRAEVWRLGALPPGNYALVDFATAFGSVCSELWLPRRHGNRFDRLDLDDRRLFSDGLNCLAQVEVETATPRYPLRTQRGVVHPVGRFVTALCGPEIRDALARGDLRRIGPGVTYFCAPHMRLWARWALARLDPADDGTPWAAKVAVKAWTRTVPGKWAGRTSSVVLELEQPVPGWRISKGRHLPTDSALTILDMGGRQYWLAQDQEADNGFPAVLAWIQSHVRVRLGRLLDLIGTDATILCNTDGVVIDVDAFTRRTDPYSHRMLGPDGRRQILEARLAGWAADCAPLTPVVKWYSRTLEVLSPQHVITDQRRQLSGVPSAATHLGQHRYSFTDWPKLSTQLEGGWTGGYRRRLRTVDLGSIPALRWVLQDGRTAPVAAAGTLETGSVLCRWPEGQNGAAGALLAARQHPLLEGLR